MQQRNLVEPQDSRSGSSSREDDDMRANLHRMWSAVAPSWSEYADEVDERGAVIAEKMLELAKLQPGERVLELACGPGGAGLAAAARVAPGGEVVLSDIAPEMITIASARADAKGLVNVSTLVLDLEQIEQPDGSYDVVLCREGLMFAADPARAAREIRRVLRPGGRVVLAVWGPRQQNPWLGIVLDTVSDQLGVPIPPPGIPGPFSLEDSTELGALLTDAGLSGVHVSDVAVSMGASSFETWWTRTSALAGPLAKVLESLPVDVVDAIRVRAREATRAYESPDGLAFPGVALLATASVP